MRWTRLLDPMRHHRLECELAALTATHEAMRADVVTYADIVGRGLDPRGDVGLLRRAMLAENDANITRRAVMNALRDMRAGRLDAARAELEAILGEAHVEPVPLHLVDRVA